MRLLLKSMMTIAAMCCLFLSLPADLQASQLEATEEKSSWLDGAALGFRVGGYGFRHKREEGIRWDGCRMDGSGIFFTYDLTDRLFAEASVDMYHAIGRVVENGMERLSLFQMGAIGVRSEPLWIVTPYLQIGMGAEWTRIEVDDRHSRKWLALGFAGFGARAEVGSFGFGANLRVALMGDADHSHDHLESEHHHADQGSTVDTRYEPAGHALFFAKFMF